MADNNENKAFGVEWENNIFRRALIDIGDKKALELFDKEQEEMEKMAEKEIEEMKKRREI